MRRALLTAVGKPDPLAGVSIGDAFMGGFYAGIIDTTKNNIIAADASQIGLRYALIDGGLSLESSQMYKTTAAASAAAADTRWDGLTATMALDSTHPAANYCAGLTYPTTDGGSAWYLPAMDELELLYRNFKPTTDVNATSGDSGSTFPGGTQTSGSNVSSDPNGPSYTSGSPAQTSIAAFQSGGAQAFTTGYYWSATAYSNSSAWTERFGGATTAGRQSGQNKIVSERVRPVRRLVLS